MCYNEYRWSLPNFRKWNTVEYDSLQLKRLKSRLLTSSLVLVLLVRANPLNLKITWMRFMNSAYKKHAIYLITSRMFPNKTQTFLDFVAAWNWYVSAKCRTPQYARSGAKRGGAEGGARSWPTDEKTASSCQTLGQPNNSWRKVHLYLSAYNVATFDLSSFWIMLLTSSAKRTLSNLDAVQDFYTELSL